jgi:hypothetical protein
MPGCSQNMGTGVDSRGSVFRDSQKAVSASFLFVMSSGHAWVRFLGGSTSGLRVQHLRLLATGFMKIIVIVLANLYLLQVESQRRDGACAAHQADEADKAWVSAPEN